MKKALREFWKLGKRDISNDEVYRIARMKQKTEERIAVRSWACLGHVLERKGMQTRRNVLKFAVRWEEQGPTKE